uniref:C3H1-type domain-containing protein n=1 Tax=Spongospora subterranea TaxID=70186 RepID=A0A0H5R563_9EUKA|eukprot:CRZ09290.1 hypothetical protein [Spongospora subterranea]
MSSFPAGSMNGNTGNNNSKGPLMDEAKLVKYKTVMCQRMVRVGSCRYGNLCDFAHDTNELRRNLNQHWYHGVICEIPKHEDKKCEFAHNEMELAYHPSIYKTKLCDKFATPSGCSKNLYCALAHGKLDLRQVKPATHHQQQQQAPAKSRGPSPTSSANHRHSPSPTHSSPTNFKRSDFEQSRPPARHAPSETTGPPPSSGPHRQQSFPVYNDPSAARSAIPPNPVSQADFLQEFQDTTNDLKIRILDLVDQISSMHSDRANHESHQKSIHQMQDIYKMHREQTAGLNNQIDKQRLLIQAQQGKVAALSRLSPAALSQLVHASAKAAAIITAFKPNNSPSHNLVKDLAELDIS